MIFIVAKFPVKPEYAEVWLDKADEFTRRTREEPGNLWYDWSRSVDDPNLFVLVEAFKDGDAPTAHVTSPHFKKAMGELGRYLQRRPDIISVQAPGEAWSKLGEIRMDD